VLAQFLEHDELFVDDCDELSFKFELAEIAQAALDEDVGDGLERSEAFQGGSQNFLHLGCIIGVGGHIDFADLLVCLCSQFLSELLQVDGQRHFLIVEGWVSGQIRAQQFCDSPDMVERVFLELGELLCELVALGGITRGVHQVNHVSEVRALLV